MRWISSLSRDLIDSVAVGGAAFQNGRVPSHWGFVVMWVACWRLAETPCSLLVNVAASMRPGTLTITPAESRGHAEGVVGRGWRRDW